LNLSAQAALEDGDPATAERLLLAALELDRASESQVGLAQDLEALAGLQAAAGRPEEAAGGLDRAFYLWAALGDRPGQERILGLLASLREASGLPKTLKPYQDVLKSPELFNPIERLCP
jgi:tetratricopeptide (TPR) repeat protein